MQRVAERLRPKALGMVVVAVHENALRPDTPADTQRDPGKVVGVGEIEGRQMLDCEPRTVLRRDLYRPIAAGNASILARAASPSKWRQLTRTASDVPSSRSAIKLNAPLLRIVSATRQLTNASAAR